MDTTWIVVASRDEVRIFERKGKKDLTLVTDIGNPEGKLRPRDLVSDKAGTSSDNRMRRRLAYSTEQSPKERSLINFYEEISDQIDLALNKQKFDRLILIAEPRLLGILRAILPSSVHGVIIQEIHKDLAFATEEQIMERL
jgi:protein required for attachment to host cells